MNGHKKCKNKIIEDIVKELENANVLTLYDIKSKLKKEKPINITEYINEIFPEKTEGFKSDFEHEVRMLWLETGPGCKENGYLISIIDDELECMWDILIANQEPDIWVQEKGTCFNPMDIAQTLFYIYIDKVVFK